MVFPAPKIALAIVPQAKGDEEKIGSGLMRLAEEDPTLPQIRARPLEKCKSPALAISTLRS